MTFLGFVFWAFSGTMLKFTNYQTDPENSWAPVIRQAGILALLLPIAWAVFTIRKERDQTTQWTLKFSLVSGLLVAWAMFYLLIKSVSYGRVEPHFHYIGL